MKEPERLAGYVKYKNQEIPFETDLEKFVLYLYPSKTQIAELYEPVNFNPSVHEWIPHTVIYGKTLNDKIVLFDVLNIPQSYYGFPNYEINWYFIGANDIDINKLSGFSLEGDIIDAFYNPLCALTKDFKVDEKNNSLTELSVSSTTPITKPCGTYTITKDLSASIEVTSYTKADLISYTNPIVAKSKLTVTTNTPTNIDSIISALESIQKFLIYITFRSDIKIHTADIFILTKDGKRYYNSLLVFPKKEFPPLKKGTKKRIIEYHYLKEQTGKLIRELHANHISIDHIPTYESKSTVTPPSIIMIFAAFERIFKSYYSTEFSSRNPKNKVSLADKIQYALNDCMEIIKPLLIKNYGDRIIHTQEELYKRMNTLRNNIAHYNLDFCIEPIHVADVHILEVLIYAVALKQLGLDTKECRYALNQLFSEYSLIEEYRPKPSFNDTIKSTI